MVGWLKSAATNQEMKISSAKLTHMATEIAQRMANFLRMQFDEEHVLTGSACMEALVADTLEKIGQAH